MGIVTCGIMVMGLLYRLHFMVKHVCCYTGSGFNGFVISTAISKWLVIIRRTSLMVGSPEVGLSRVTNVMDGRVQ
jgi:hypothetical protein